MRELRAELAAFPSLGRASMGSLGSLSRVALVWRRIRGRTGLDRGVGLRRELAELRREAELKDGFIALASHELRAPAAVVYGFGETLRAPRRRARAATISRELHGVLQRAGGAPEPADRPAARPLRLEANVVRARARAPAGARAARGSRRERRRRARGRRRAEGGRRPGDRRRPDRFERIVGQPDHERDALRARADRDPRRAERPPLPPHGRRRRRRRPGGARPAALPALRAGRGRARAPGLGLSIAQSYAQANGGQILYEPTAEGGARFQLVLPARRAGKLGRGIERRRRATAPAGPGSVASTDPASTSTKPDAHSEREVLVQDRDAEHRGDGRVHVRDHRRAHRADLGDQREEDQEGQRGADDGESDDGADRGGRTASGRAS